MRSLWVRLSIVSVAVLAVSLTTACVLANQLLLRSGRSGLDDALHREDARLQAMVTAAADSSAVPGATTAAAAVQDYLRLFPDTDAYLTVTRIGTEVLTAPNKGPDVLEGLLADGELPSGPNDRVVTLNTTKGEIRSLTSPILVGSTPVGTFQVAGPLGPVRQRAGAATGRLVAAAALSLLLGAALVAAALRAGLRPLRGLSAAAQATDLNDLSARVPYAARRDELGTVAREFNRMLQRLETAATARRDLLAGVSHELRTPITICLGHVEMLQLLGDRDPLTLRQTTGVVSEELRRMRLMVDDLMALARSETNEFVSPRPVHLPGFLDDTRLRVVGLQLDGVVFAGSPEATVMLDPDRLGQAVLNLVVNARAHTPAGTTVTVAAELAPRELRITVADDGCGIDPSIRANAFDPFVRGPRASRDGHGLGLAVVRAVAQAHAGTVRIDTGETGTRVSLVIPVAHSDPTGREPGTVPVRAQTTLVQPAP